MPSAYTRIRRNIRDLLLAGMAYPAALLLLNIRKRGIHRLPYCKQVLQNVGVFPIRNHYYEPLIDVRALKRSLEADRNLVGIDWNTDQQLSLLDSFHYNDELREIPADRKEELLFRMNNGSFESGDAEYFYNLIRLKKPRRLFEIGSGQSTLLAMKALKANEREVPAYSCEHVCIEPYENPWLEKTGIKILRQKVEDVDFQIFEQLQAGDFLFIDSSHVIRPQGDVLFEYLELLPALKPGVIVHIHDIYSPRDYPKSLVVEKMMLWNEQYLLEAFLTSNRDWRIIGALNYLRHHHFSALQAKCPFLTQDREPGSFYIEKVG